MEDWMENKKVHEGLWGELYHRVISNNKSFNDLKSEWLDLFRFEMKGVEDMEYILEGKIVKGDFAQYVNDKNQYLQTRLNKYITPTTEAVVDLGSGWGRHSIQLSFNNPKYNIICGELSDNGRKTTEYFIKKYKLPIKTFQFNWYNHQSLIDLLKNENYREIVIFTTNTIEQIPYLNKEVFVDLVNLPIDKISVIHIEPVAFQYNDTDFPFNNHYNRNLKEILDIMEDEKLIEVKTLSPRYYGHSSNITSKNNILIEWIKI